MAERVRVTAGRGLNVREGPGTQYRKVGALPYGAVVTVTERRGVWGGVWVNGTARWIHLGYTEPVDDAPPEHDWLDDEVVDLSLWNKVEPLFWRSKRPWVTVVKATQGLSILDPTFGERWVRLRWLDWPRWAYHFYDPQFPGEAQAEGFLRVTGLREGERAVLDLERIPAHERLAWAANEVEAWLQAVEDATGAPPVVYTRRDVWTAYFGRSEEAWAEAKGWPLWVADYRGASEPLAVPGWKRWALWQYTGSGSWPGVAGHVDRSRVARWFADSVNDK